MARTGRPPKPTRLKVLTGNPGHRPLNDQEPQPRVGEPRCPSWLDAEAKRTWKSLVAELKAIGLLTVVDGLALSGLCQAWSEFRLSTETLRREGRFIQVGGSPQVDAEGKTIGWVGGQRQSHPAVAQQRSAWKAVREFCSLFGLDPSSRTRIKVPGGGGEKDELDAFLEG